MTMYRHEFLATAQNLLKVLCGSSVLRLLACLAIVVIFAVRGYHVVPSSAFEKSALDQYWGSDTWRVAEQINDTRIEPYYRDKVHPLFSLIAVTTTSLLKSATGCSELECGIHHYRIPFALIGLLSFYLMLYLHTTHTVALSSTVLLVSTASWKTWVSLPETFLFGFATISLALLAYTLSQRPRSLALITVISFAGTITNGVIGILGVLFSIKKFRRQVVIVGTALITLVLLAAAQQAAYSTSTPFFDLFALREEVRYVHRDVLPVPARIADFIYSGFVLPPIESRPNVVSSIAAMADFFGGLPGFWDRSTDYKLVSLLYLGALALTTAVLVASVVLMARPVPQRAAGGLPVTRSASCVIAIFLLFKLALHSFYGDMPFLYSLEYTPLLIALAALTVGVRLQYAYLVMCIALAYCLNHVNYRVLNIIFDHSTSL